MNLRRRQQKCGVSRNHATMSFDIFYFEKDFEPHQVYYRAEPVEVAAMTDDQVGIPVAPLLSLNDEAAQNLMDSLWETGLRPSKGVASSGQVEAMSNHITDLRKISHKLLKIEDAS